MKEIEIGLFLDDFEAEARMHIETIEKAFLDVSALANDIEAVNGVFRAVHSLKGTAGFFSLEKIVTVTHELENIFSLIKDGKLAINSEIEDLTLQSVDCLNLLVDALRNDSTVDITPVTAKLAGYIGSNKTAKTDTKEAQPITVPFDLQKSEIEKSLRGAISRGHKVYYLNINFDRSLGDYYTQPEGLVDNIISVGAIVETIIADGSDDSLLIYGNVALSEKIKSYTEKKDTFTIGMLVTSVLEHELFSIAIEIEKRKIHLLPNNIIISVENAADKNEIKEHHKPKTEPKLDVDVLQADAPQKDWIGTSTRDSTSIRLSVNVINSLMDLANEMILSRNQLLSVCSDYRKSITGLTPVLHDISRLTSEIQEKIMLTRMQPISMIFNKFPRIIRDVARSLDKDINLEIIGDEVMLDKFLLDALTDPITQLVKNSADHGIEDAERRRSLGKPLKGTLTLNAYMCDGSAIIEITDDGAGIDIERLTQKAIERGADAESFASRSKEDILNMIFEPGISTAQTVTNMSGRGVGMDIVKTNIERLGGSIEIITETNIGTTIRLKMPITLSVVRTLIVKIDGIQYAVSEVNVERLIRVCSSLPSKRLERLNNALVLSINGRIIPVITMTEITAKVRGNASPPIDVLYKTAMKGDVAKFLVLKAGGKSFALLIDDAIETVETLVKPLPIFLRGCSCYSNITVLGSGNAIMILDADGISHLMNHGNLEKQVEFEPEIAVSKNEKQIIVFKCSGAEYFALETCEISRIESIDSDSIQEIGDDFFINIAGVTVHIVRPEDYAPIQKRGYTSEKLYLITLKNSPSPVGFLAGKVIDKVEREFKLDTDHLSSDFIYGTSVWNKRVLVFLNSNAVIKQIELEKRLIKGRDGECL